GKTNNNTHVGTVDVEGSGGATLDGVAVMTHSGADTIEGGQTTIATLTLEGGASMTGGKLVLGAAGGSGYHPHIGIVDVEGNAGATLDGVTVTAFATADTIEIGKNGRSTLTLDDGTIISGPGTPKSKSGSTLDVERGNGSGSHGATLDGLAVSNSGSITVASTATLKLDDGTTVTGGSLIVHTGGMLDVEKGGDASAPYGAVLDDVNVT